MSRWTVLVLVSTTLLLVLDYVWRVTSISLRKALPIVLLMWLIVIAAIWYWMA